MPSMKKTLHYLGSTLLSAIAVGLLGFGMSTDWSTTTFKCSRTVNGSEPGSVVVTLGLFNGIITRNICPFSDDGKALEVIPRLADEMATPAALQVIVVFLLALCLLCSAVSILISLYNSVSNPYETYLGPRGIYTCNSASAILSLLVLIFSVCNVFLANSAGVLVTREQYVVLDAPVTTMQVGYFMTIPYLVLSLVACTVVYIYHHMAYRQTTQQQKPTEDAPMETMMY